MEEVKNEYDNYLGVEEYIDLNHHSEEVMKEYNNLTNCGGFAL